MTLGTKLIKLAYYTYHYDLWLPMTMPCIPNPVHRVLLGIFGEAELVGHVYLLPTCELGTRTPERLHSKLDLLFFGAQGDEHLQDISGDTRKDMNMHWWCILLESSTLVPSRGLASILLSILRSMEMLEMQLEGGHSKMTRLEMFGTRFEPRFSGFVSPSSAAQDAQLSRLAT